MFIDYISDDSYSYFILHKNTIIVKMSNDSGRIVEYKKLENSSRQGLFNRAIDCEYGVLFVPSHSKEFILVNKKNLEIKRIKIPEIEISKRDYAFFSDGVLCANKIYAFGLSYPGIVKIDLSTKTTELIVDLRKYNFGELIADNCIIDNYVYIPFKESNSIIRFDYTTESIEIIQMDRMDTSCNKAIAFDGNAFWLISDNNYVHRFDKNFRVIGRDYMLEKLISEKEVFRCIYSENYIYIFFLNDNRILKYSILKDDDYSWILVPCEKNDLRPVYYAGLKNYRLCFYSESADCFFYINNDAGVSPYFPFNKQDYLNMIMVTDGVVKEMNGFGIEDYLRCLKYEEKRTSATVS